MFTGLVSAQGKLLSVRRHSQEIELACKTPLNFLEHSQVGDSICVSGTCLTATAMNADSFTADIMPETFARTIFSQLSVGACVNLEKALAVGSRFEGHIVQGHVDAAVRLTGKKRQQHALVLTFDLPEAYADQVVEKGSVALNGVSLTVLFARNHEFAVSLIPHSQAETNLEALTIGSQVNMETDILGKYVQKQLHFNSKDKVGVFQWQ